MSDSEAEVEENFCFFGKPLDPYDEDSIPRKKPISIEEQTATDAQGRRRFHGAFTGGFSAGFFNTVGSLEGWKPSEFRSTRSDKARSVNQTPSDFMDDEDVSEYGIAHSTVKAKDEFSTSKKRKRRQIFADGPIPGEPVLQTLLTSGNETIGYLLLKNIGVKSKIDDLKEELIEEENGEKVYGCEMPKIAKNEHLVTRNLKNQFKVPEIYETFLKKPKLDTFGLGYENLSKTVEKISFSSRNFVVKDRNDKKLVIGGQAFGVGAFEDEDDDIYAKEDVSNYDFELTNEKKSKLHSNNDSKAGKLVLGFFKRSTNPISLKKIYPPPKLPHSFTGKFKVRKSRFEPLKEVKVERKEMDASVRARYLGESESKVEASQSSEKDSSARGSEIDEGEEDKVGSFLSKMSDRFVSASLKEDLGDILKAVEKTETEHGTKDMREAAKMKMFGALTRVRVDWMPCAVLCKKFNVPEPNFRPEEQKKKRTKNLIFEYQKFSEENANLTPGLNSQTDSKKSESSDLQIKKETDILDLTGSDELGNENNKNSASKTIEKSEKDGELMEEKAELKDSDQNTKESENVIIVSDVTEKVNVENKLDLFKAVFLDSSSDSEEEDEKEGEEEAENRNKSSVRFKEGEEELRANVLSDVLLPTIKPIKEGILSNVNFASLFDGKNKNQIDKEKSKELVEGEKEEAHCSNFEDKNVLSKNDETSDLYGPKLPGFKCLQKVRLEIDVKSDGEDEWVEKGSKKSRKRKKTKKSKKKEHKRSKKHKSKVR